MFRVCIVMDKNLVLAVFFLFLVVADASKAKFRKLAAAPPENNSTLTQVILNVSFLYLIFVKNGII